MNLRNKLRKFFTLSRRHEAGFTLIELIVVIAILGILGGVGTVAYSGYMKKANMAADQTLVSDVAKALQMYYYDSIANGTEMESGFVVLTPEGIPCKYDENGVGLAAMDAAFGDGWEESISLSYGDWTDDGMLDIVTDYSQETLDLIHESTFMTKSSPEALMSTVTDMAGLVSGVIKGSDMSKAAERLNNLLGADSDAVKTLNEMTWDTSTEEGKEEYSIAISNLLVNHMAGSINDASDAELEQDGLTQILYMYATLYAYAQHSGDEAPLTDMQNKLKDMEFETLEDIESRDDCWAFFMDENDGSAALYEGYVGSYVATEDGMYEADTDALKAMMGAVEQIAGTYKDKDSITNPELFSSGAVSEQVKNYINAVNALAGMDETTRNALKNLQEDSIVVFVAEDGSVSAIPGAAWLMP